MRRRFLLLVLALAMSSPAFAGPTNTAVLDVPGMTCPLCPITVKTALERVSGVDKVAVDFPARTVRVNYDPSKTTPAALLKATADAGYPANLEKRSKS